MRRIASEHNIDLANVSGTGREGRVMKEDILRHIEEGQHLAKKPKNQYVEKQEDDLIHKPKKPPAFTPRKSAPPTRATSTGSTTEQPFNAFTKGMFKKMSEALLIPHFVYNDEVDMTRMVQVRAELNSLQSDIKLSYLPFMIKAASLALERYPGLNASVDVGREVIVLKDFHNIGLAMDTPNGLVVPNVKNVQDKSILDIAHDILRLSELGKKGKLGGEDLSGGTFTLSNIGSVGGTYASPVIMAPEVAIAALGKIQKLPRFDDDGNVVARHMLNVSWAADHRILDGATVARFSNAWKMSLEAPSTLLLSLK